MEELIRGMREMNDNKIQRVLSNLLDNTIKYTPRGGSITVSAYGSDYTVRVFVRDTGIGIPETEMPYLFDRFFHRGTIAVTSTTGRGSEFTITLPKVQP